MLILEKEVFLNPDYLDSNALNMAKQIIKNRKYDKINDNEAAMEGSTILYIKNPSLELLPHNDLISKKVFFNIIVVEDGEVDVEWEKASKLNVIKDYNILEDATYHEGTTQKITVKAGQILVMPLEHAMKISEVRSNMYIWMDCNKYTGMKALSGTALTI